MIMSVLNRLLPITLAPLVPLGLLLGSLPLPKEAGSATLSNPTYSRNKYPATLQKNRLRIAPGFEIELFATVRGARSIRATSQGDLLVSSPVVGGVFLVESDTGSVRTLLSRLNAPHGIDLHDGWLYVGETHGIGRVRFDARTRQTSGTYQRVVKGLPNSRMHGLRALRFGPDGHLYVSVGSSCNACIEHDSRHATILRYAPDGSSGKIYATGLRNSVGFAWHPVTNKLYATDNGRDWLGDDFPPCELNLVVEGGFYGWPFANGDRVLDPDEGNGHEAEAEASSSPVHFFRAHSAPLGITFLRNGKLPAPWRNAALVALHGSWNRTKKDGYKIVALEQTAEGLFRQHDFVVGFLEYGRVLGRPVDITEAPNGTIYASDDYTGSIYRIRFSER